MSSHFYHSSIFVPQSKKKKMNFRLIFLLIFTLTFFCNSVWELKAQTLPPKESKEDNQENSLKNIWESWDDKIQENKDKTQEKPNSSSGIPVDNPTDIIKPNSNSDLNNQENSNNTASREAPTLLGSALRLFFATSILLFLFYVCVSYIRKKNTRINLGNNDLVQVIISVPLIQGKFLQIVNIAGRFFILGVSEKKIELLDIIQDVNSISKIQMWESQQENSNIANVAQKTSHWWGALMRFFQTTKQNFWQDKENVVSFKNTLQDHIFDQETQEQFTNAQTGISEPKSAQKQKKSKKEELELRNLEELLIKQKKRLHNLEKKKEMLKEDN